MPDLPIDGLLPLFDRGFAALWRRAHRTLGDVTLTAIADRVLYTATERYPALSSIEIDANGIRCHGLQKRVGSLDDAQVTEGLRFMLAEFLTVLGNLTAEILTPALHSELAKVAPEVANFGPNESRGESSNAEPKRKDAKS